MSLSFMAIPVTATDELATMGAFQIVEHMCKKAGVSPWEIRGRSRLREHVILRRKIAKYLRSEGYSYPAIGRALGNRDHTSIMYYLGALGRQKP